MAIIPHHTPMITIAILLVFVLLVFVISRKISSKKRQSYKVFSCKGLNEDVKKPALNIPGYYDDIVNKDKLKKNYRWELHQSF